MEPKNPDIDLKEVAAAARAGLDIKDRTYRFKTYRACFVGRDLVKWFQ